MRMRSIVFLFIVMLGFGILISGIGVAQDGDGDEAEGDEGVADEERGDDVVEEEEPEEVEDDREDDDFDDGFDDEEEFDDFDEEEYDDDDFDDGDEDNEIDLDDIDEFTDDELEEELDPGLTPDSALYFLDTLFEGEDARAEKIAEIRQMIREGKIEDARRALEEYKKHVRKIEENPDPEDREKHRRKAAAIHRALGDIESDISREDKEEFYDDIIREEEEILTAVEISGRIRDLCRALSSVDPLAYSRSICNTNEDSHEWQRDFDRDLTEDQEREAREFFGIMSECIETSGRECRCNDISIPAFADKCVIIAPLEALCDDESVPEEVAENACDEVDELTEDIEDLLPDYLIDVLEEVIEGFEEDDFGRHGGPPECAGLDFRACMLRMAEEHIQNAPFECQEALRQGILDGTIENERDGRAVCEDALYRFDRPPRCDEADDPRRCAERYEGDFRRGDSGHGFDFGRCASISDSQARLQCFDDGFQGDFHDDGRSFQERLDETFERERICASDCSSQGGKPWDFSSGVCSCGDVPDRGEYDDYYDDYYGDYDDDHPDFDYKSDSSTPYDCNVMFCGDGSYCDSYRGCVSDDGGSDFDDYPEEEYYPPEEDYSGEHDNSGEGSYDESYDEGSYDNSGEGNYEDSGDSYDGGGESGGDSGGDSGGGDEASGDDGGDSGDGGGGDFTGEVVGGYITGNLFLDYHFGWWS